MRILVAPKECDRSETAIFGGWVNAGVYAFRLRLIGALPADVECSLEREWLPGLLPDGVFAYPVTGDFIDIGTPESYAEAQRFFRAPR